MVLGIWGIRDMGTFALHVTESPFPLKVCYVDYMVRLVLPHNPDEGPKGKMVGSPRWLPESSTGRIEAGKNAVFWLTVHVPPDASPGEYKGKLTLTIWKSSADPQNVEIPFTVEVLPFKLPRANVAFGMYYYKNIPHGRYRSAELEKKYFEDMAAHGHTSGTMSGRMHDEQGNIKKGTPTEHFIDTMLQTGLLHKDIPVIYNTNLPTDPQKLRAAGCQLRTFAKSKGWPELLLYGIDEPGQRGADLSGFEVMEPVRAGLRTVTAISGQHTGKYGKYLDVWVVLENTLSPATQELARKMGAELWTYSCGGGRSSEMNIPYERFYAGLFTWLTRAKGNFIWAYINNPKQPPFARLGWEQNRSSTHTSFVMPSDTGPIASVGWEARREGIEDYRYLQLLQELIRKNPYHPSATKAKGWLRRLHNRVSPLMKSNRTPWQWQVLNPEVRCAFTFDNQIFFYPAIDVQPSNYSILRRQCGELIIELMAEREQ